VFIYYFSNRNELIASASKGDAQKHSIASPGVQTKRKRRKEKG